MQELNELKELVTHVEKRVTRLGQFEKVEFKDMEENIYQAKNNLLKLDHRVTKKLFHAERKALLCSACKHDG